MAKSKVELERENAELKKALEGKSRLDHTLSQADMGANYIMVPIRNYGSTTVSIEYEYKGMTKVLVLGTNDPKNLGVIPLEVWTELERTSKLVSDGYIARTDVPITNPNVIPDDEAFIKSHGEAEFAKKVELITNVHVLFRLLKCVEFNKSKAGKYLSAASVLKQRIFDVTETYGKKEDGTLYSLNTGIRMVDEEE